jgi:hypothetical protein
MEHAARADEGQWQPSQVKGLGTLLRPLHLEHVAKRLGNLARAPLAAVVSLGGCTGSFVSKDGLIVTNHHCAYGAIQRNSTAERNFLERGFLASSRAAEVPAGPNQRIYVTQGLDDVTAQVLGGLDSNLDGKARQEAIENKSKQLVAACEKDPAYRCSVVDFYRGLHYVLVRQWMIRDVRLVYAPAEAVGNFGGDIDNFEWPRHTGDFSFLRAYVGKDGRPADPSPENVPYKPQHYLKLDARGISQGDAVIVAGYPGKTSRYRLPSEVRFAFSYTYPHQVAEMVADLEAIDRATQGQSETKVRYASVVKMINNRLKKARGLIDGNAISNLESVRTEQDRAHRSYLASQANGQQTLELLRELEQWIAADQALAREEFAWSVATKSDLLHVALRLERWHRERQKPDAQRERGFQDRDESALKASFARLEQSFDSRVDAARWQAALARYEGLVGAGGRVAGLPERKHVGALYQASALHRTETRVDLIGASAAAYEQALRDDAFLGLARQLSTRELALEARRKEIEGNFDRLLPRYMESLIAWKSARGEPIYPDANSTLRISFGRVDSYPAADGVTKGPFTTLQGIVHKNRGVAPFNAPSALLAAIADKRGFEWVDREVQSVPVNFLSSADTTGGNSGSPVLNQHGDLVGLNFDSAYESITKDWVFDAKRTRAIHVDIRYMLWIMSEVDRADLVLEELEVRR